VLGELLGHRHLGIHTEALTDGVVDLVEAGAVDNSRKQVRPGKSLCGFVLGTRRLYDFVDDNPSVSLRSADMVNDPRVIATNDNVVAINSALEIDLTGQVNADSIGPSVYSGFGGQVDFIRGAARSVGGRPVIALPSTAKGGSISRIVPTLRPGAGVVTTRADVHYVVTEHGIADLFGRPLHERIASLIEIADPAHREQLEADARSLGVLR
jgi:acetyl-CoA hydrolase